jgi:23S rRNA (adenine2503-C2)-methyltransferase
MSWLYKTPVASFDEMTNISKDTRQKLKETAFIEKLIYTKDFSSSEAGTKKYVFKSNDGSVIETVKIRSGDKITICVSSQVGCPIKCSFCATGKVGFKRNLDAGEILSQIMYFVRNKKPPLTNIVFMGMGEPLLNYKNLMKSIHIINSPEGMNFGIRRITISTCGLPKEIRKLAKENLEFNLSISLNAPNDTIRDSIMPINRQYPIAELLKAVRYYIQNTNRRVTFEYVMIRGVNDSIKDAKELSNLLPGILCHVNLIPYNEVEGSNLKGSNWDRIVLFNQILAHSGVNVTIRKSRGKDIKAACGQLAAIEI